MIHNTGDNQRHNRIKCSDLSCPFILILGESYLTYFRKKRMSKAAELLTTTNLKIIDIANTVGYENQGKFANVFAKEYGITPLEFRRLSGNAIHFHTTSD